MSAFYDEMQEEAEDLIAEFGLNCVLRKKTNSGTEYAPSKSNSDTTVIGVDLDISERENPNSMGSVRVRKVIMSTSAGVVPAQKDLFVIGMVAGDVTSGTQFVEVEEVRPLSPGGTDLLYELELAAHG